MRAAIWESWPSPASLAASHCAASSPSGSVRRGVVVAVATAGAGWASIVVSSLRRAVGPVGGGGVLGRLGAGSGLAGSRRARVRGGPRREWSGRACARTCSPVPLPPDGCATSSSRGRRGCRRWSRGRRRFPRGVAGGRRARPARGRRRGRRVRGVASWRDRWSRARASGWQTRRRGRR